MVRRKRVLGRKRQRTVGEEWEGDDEEEHGDDDGDEEEAWGWLCCG